MPCERHPHAHLSHCCQRSTDASNDLISRLDLTAYAHLHVIDKERHALWIANVL
jgi:hypothetical protein